LPPQAFLRLGSVTPMPMRRAAAPPPEQAAAVRQLTRREYASREAPRRVFLSVILPTQPNKVHAIYMLLTQSSALKRMPRPERCGARRRRPSNAGNTTMVNVRHTEKNPTRPQRELKYVTLPVHFAEGPFSNNSFGRTISHLLSSVDKSMFSVSGNLSCVQAGNCSRCVGGAVCGWTGNGTWGQSLLEELCSSQDTPRWTVLGPGELGA